MFHVQCYRRFRPDGKPVVDLYSVVDLSDDDDGNSIGLIIGVVLAAAAIIGVGLLVVVMRSGRRAA